MRILKLQQQGVELSTEKIQDAIRSATISLIEMDEQEFFIKNEPNEDFKDMLHALGLNDAPAYGKKSDAYIRPEKYNLGPYCPNFCIIR